MGERGLPRGGFDTAKSQVQPCSAFLAYSTTEFPLSYAINNNADIVGG
jgi:hypothetical protein